MLARITQLGISENQTTLTTPVNARPHTAGVLGKNARAAVEIVGSVPA